MRWLAFFVLLVLLAPARASGAREPPFGLDVTVEGEPSVAAPFTLTVGLRAQEETEARLRLDVPAWVEVEDEAAWNVSLAAGERAQRAWRLTATEPGFWRAALVSDEGPVEGCCLYAWSIVGRGIASTQPAAAVPAESSVGFHPSLRPLDAERAELTVRVSPQDKRYAGQELAFVVPGAPEQTASADAPHEFRHAFALRDGAEEILTASAAVRVTFEPGPHGSEPVVVDQRIACAQLRVTRVGDEVREAARTGCDAPPEASTPTPGAGDRRVPLPGTLGAAAVAAAMLIARALAKTYPRRPA